MIGNAGQTNKLYPFPTTTDFNSFASISSTDIGTETDDTRSIAVADVDSDGYQVISAAPSICSPNFHPFYCPTCACQYF